MVTAACLYGIPTALVLLLIALFALGAGDTGMAVLFAVLALPLLVAGGLVYLASRWDQKRFEQAGDYEVWPFFHRWDLEEAAKKPRLL